MLQILLNSLFYSNTGKDNRKYYIIWNPSGNIGKSLWKKMMAHKHGDEVGLLSLANPSQLKETITHMGAKKTYTLDTPNSISKLAS